MDLSKVKNNSKSQKRHYFNIIFSDPHVKEIDEQDLGTDLATLISGRNYEVQVLSNRLVVLIFDKFTSVPYERINYQNYTLVRVKRNELPDYLCTHRFDITNEGAFDCYLNRKREREEMKTQDLLVNNQ